MIVSGTPQFKRVFQSLGPHLLTLLAWDLLVVVVFKVLHWEWISSRDLPLALLRIHHWHRRCLSEQFRLFPLVGGEDSLGANRQQQPQPRAAGLPKPEREP